MTYTITYTADSWQPIGSSFYQTVRHEVDPYHALFVVLEWTPPSAVPHVHDADMYQRDGLEWTRSKNIEPKTVQVCINESEALRERAYGA